ncbi:MAG: DUF5916 domain-containing protein [Acidobacteria bacterium]|nr:DUF5916 domain-containing protein [Acidobacteriota bacterium]
MFRLLSALLAIAVTTPRVAAPITLDGRLDEAAWAAATPVSGFIQREPDELQPATEDTEVRAVYDATTLYFAVRAYDSDPSAIVALEMQRDGRLFRDDAVAILLDTFHDHRNVYFFETNANGARTDGLVSNEGDDFNLDWDGVWSVASRIDSEGWTAEFAIPFRTLRLDPRLDVWALQIRRFIRRKNEPTFFAPLGLEDNFFKISKAGHLTGLHDVETGLALNVKPYVTAAVGDSEEEGSVEDSEIGLDVKWGITRGLGLDVTLNTDFAETEVDEIQVNLTRFSLFFPEKREFFLENSGIFEFGTPGGRRGPLFRLFFSRRIGISEEGDPVPLDWGVRLAGKVGRWSLGLIEAHTDSLSTEEEEVAETDWTVLRLEREVGARSSVGVLATLQDPDVGDSSSAYGVDWTIRPTNRLSIWGFGASSDNADSATGTIFGSGVEWQNRVWRVESSLVDIGEDFDPAAGFLRRSGVRRTGAKITYSPRPEPEQIRNYEFELEFERFKRDDGSIESQEFQVNFFGLTTENGTTFSLFSQFRQEGLDEDFEIADDVIIPADDYSFQDFGLFFSTNQGRPWAFRGFAVGGDFFDGRRRRSNITGTWRPSKFLSSETSWNRSQIDLPAGDFVTNVVRQRVAASFSPDLSLSALLQFSDVDEELGLNLRFNWIYEPGADLFVVFNQSWNAPDALSTLESIDRRVTVKFTYLLQR